MKEYKIRNGRLYTDNNGYFVKATENTNNACFKGFEIYGKSVYTDGWVTDMFTEVEIPEVASELFPIY